jgi:hypothetical protein
MNEQVAASGQAASRRRRVWRLILIGTAAILLAGGIASWVESDSVNGRALDYLRVAWDRDRRAFDHYSRAFDDRRRAWEERRRAEEQARRPANTAAPDAPRNPAEDRHVPKQ